MAINEDSMAEILGMAGYNNHAVWSKGVQDDGKWQRRFF